MDSDDGMDNLRAATKKLANFNDQLDSYREAAPTPEKAAGLIVDQQAAADTAERAVGGPIVAVLRPGERRRPAA